jgi:hypothetical protein
VFSLFYSVSRGKLEGRISNYTMAAFFLFLCTSLLTIFRRFTNIRPYILTNVNIDREVKNRKINFPIITLFPVLFFSFLREIEG